MKQDSEVFQIESMGWSLENWGRFYLTAYRDPLKFFASVRLSTPILLSIAVIFINSMIMGLPQLISGVSWRWFAFAPLFNIFTAVLNSFLLFRLRRFLKIEVDFQSVLSLSCIVSLLILPLFLVPYLQQFASIAFLVIYWWSFYAIFKPRLDRLIAFLLVFTGLFSPLFVLLYFFAMLLVYRS